MSLEKSNSSLQRNELKKFTTARVGLSTSGVSLSTEEVLAFRLAHARAVDAVWVEWNATSIQEKLKSRGVESIIIESTATSRLQYVQNPLLGCELNGPSIEIVKAIKNENAISIILADGLSPKAVEEQGCKLITALLDELRSIGNQINPIFICRNGRVAIGDQLGEITKCKIAIVIIGGFGNMAGTIIAGLLVGLIEAFTTQYLDSGVTDLVVFALLLIMLLVKPTGLIAEKKDIEINTNIDIQAFESVDQIVSSQIVNIDSDQFDKNILLSIYNSL